MANSDKIKSLKEYLKRIDTLVEYNIHKNDSQREEFQQWNYEVQDFLKTTFGENSDELLRFKRLHFDPMSRPASPETLDREYKSDLTTSKAILKSAIVSLGRNNNSKNVGLYLSILIFAIIV